MYRYKATKLWATIPALPKHHSGSQYRCHRKAQKRTSLFLGAGELSSWGWGKVLRNLLDNITAHLKMFFFFLNHKNKLPGPEMFCLGR